MNSVRERLKDKKRIVVKIGSSSLQHKETGGLDFTKMDVLVRELCNLKNQGKDVVLVTSGAIAEGKKAVRIGKDDNPIAVKQACAAIGQARLMMTYQKIFAEYNQVTAQILMTKNTIVDDLNRFNAHNTFMELLKLGAIPVVNENDTVATEEIEFGEDDDDIVEAAKELGIELPAEKAKPEQEGEFNNFLIETEDEDAARPFHRRAWHQEAPKYSPWGERS